MTTQHTPTPWKVLQAGDPSGVPRVTSDKGGVAVICVNRYMGEKGPSAEESANAAFIVRACNAHDELVAALTLAKYVLATLSLDDDCTEGQPEALAAARAALAKVQP